MKKHSEPRSMFTTITAAAAGLVSLGISLLLLPLEGLGESVTFVAGLLVTFVFAVTAYEGKRGTLLDAFMSLGNWR